MEYNEIKKKVVEFNDNVLRPICDFKDNKCLKMRELGGVSCCEDGGGNSPRCKQLGENGCKTFNLFCSVWACPTAIKAMTQDEKEQYKETTKLLPSPNKTFTQSGEKTIYFLPESEVVRYTS